MNKIFSIRKKKENVPHIADYLKTVSNILKAKEPTTKTKKNANVFFKQSRTFEGGGGVNIFLNNYMPNRVLLKNVIEIK